MQRSARGYFERSKPELSDRAPEVCLELELVVIGDDVVIGVPVVICQGNQPDHANRPLARTGDTFIWRHMMIRCAAEALSLEDNIIDTVVTTWTLCSIPDVQHALGEVRRL
jgi:hypothetical protein